MNVHVTLITTPPNAVLDALQHLDGISLTLNSLPKAANSNESINESEQLLIVYRCPRLVSKDFYSRFTMAVNIHPSLLPMYAGLNPWDEMFANGETSGGVTIHRLTPLADQGEILMQEAFDFPLPLSMDSARRQADFLAARMIQTLIRDIQVRCKNNMGDPKSSGL